MLPQSTVYPKEEVGSLPNSLFSRRMDHAWPKDFVPRGGLPLRRKFSIIERENQALLLYP